MTTTKRPLYFYINNSEPQWDEVDRGYFAEVWVRPVYADDPKGLCTLRWPDTYGEEKVYHDLFLTGLVHSKRAVAKNVVYTLTIGYELYNSRRYPLELSEIEGRAKALRAWTTKFDKVRDHLGYPRSFGQYVQWWAEAMGVKGIIRDRRGMREEKYLVPGPISDVVDAIAIDAAYAVRQKAGLPADLPEFVTT